MHALWTAWTQNINNTHCTNVRDKIIQTTLVLKRLHILLTQTNHTTKSATRSSILNCNNVTCNRVKGVSKTVYYFKKKISNSNNSDGTTITVLSHCTALHISACFQLAVKVLRKGKISTTKPLLCCCNQSAEFCVIRHGLVSPAKYLLPAASNCTLEVLQPNVVGESETTKPTTTRNPSSFGLTRCLTSTNLLYSVVSRSYVAKKSLYFNYRNEI